MYAQGAVDAGAGEAEEDAEFGRGLCPSVQVQRGEDRVELPTHCGLGAPQSTQRLFSFVLEISCNLLFVSGSTSHSFDIVSGLFVLFEDEVGGRSRRSAAVVLGQSRGLLSYHGVI